MRFLFHGLDDVEAHIEQMKGDLSHLAIHRRAKSKAFEERLGRYDFTLDDARRALSLPDRYGLCSDLHDAADEAIDDGDLDDPDDTSAATREPTPEQVNLIARGALAFVRHTLSRSGIGAKGVRCRIRAYRPKGMGIPINATVYVTDTNIGEFEGVTPDDEQDATVPAEDTPFDHPVPDTPAPAAPRESFQMSSFIGRQMQELGTCYADFANLLLGSMTRVQTLNDGMHRRLSYELTQSRKQVDTLMAALLDHRIQQLEVSERAVEGERSARSRSDLASQAVKELGDAAKAFLGGGGLAGLPPELLSSIAPLLQHPELRALLGDPPVLGLLRDPRFLGDLAAMLRNVAAQAKAAQAAQNGAQQGAQTPPPSAPPA